VALEPRNFFEVTFMVKALACLLDALHRLGLVHRDVKPDNAILLIQSTKWRLLDLGIVARAGERKWPQCTLAYAPPDIVCAAKEDRHVEITPAQDVWALAVMCYEATVGAVTFTSVVDIGECAYGRAPYPWERPVQEQPTAWRRSRVRALVLPCLARDPARRPTAPQLIAELGRNGHATPMRG
jgi:eukaryotic-like serine/threonine-protein kinase